MRAKLYSYKVGDVEEKKCKGVSKDVVKKHVSLQDYKDVLFGKGIMRREMVTFKSDLHNVTTQKMNKIALSGNDDKRYICEDGISTLALRHKNIM